MGIKTKVKIGDEWVNGEEINFQVEQDDWHIYKLEDGTIVKLKVLVTKIIRTEKWNPNLNDPIYSVSSSIVIETIVPENLKRKS